MTVGEIWAQLESDLAWRQEELRLLSNSLAAFGQESDRDRARRAQLVMLYAHTEGYFKVALLTYIRALNELAIKCSDAMDGIAASSFFRIFHAVTYGDPKGKVFKDPLPEDAGLHVFCRQRDFIRQIDQLLAAPLKLADGAVDTESNLNSKVLRRNLFRLGFPADKFSSYENDLDELVYRRHDIAHGLNFDTVRKQLYERLQRSAFSFMDELTLAIVDSVENSRYLRNAAPAA